MQDIIEKADVLIEALPYIKDFHGKRVVVKFGGSTMSEPDIMHRVLEDIVFMKYVGMKPVIIHGGGPAISEEMKKQGLAPKFIDGLRVTCRKTMDIVEDVLVHKINKEIVSILNDMQGNAHGISGRDGGFISVEKHMPKRQTHDKPLIKEILMHLKGDKLDLGFVGKVKQINPLVLQELEREHKIPVISPVGVGPDGLSYNVNGDSVAGEITAALGAEKLVFLTDVAGILKDPEDVESLISTISKDEIEDLIKRGTICGGMVPKAKAGLKALEFGVHKTHIVDGRISHSLLLEMFTNKGIGTQIVP